MENLKVSQLQNGILKISLNRPTQLNALSQTLLTELAAVLTEVKTDPAIKAILLTGEGKGFCAGADINQLSKLTAQQGLAFAKFGQSVFNQLEQLGKPTLALIQGFAFGGGCELAMAASFRIAATNAVFGQPEIKLGVIPGFGGTQRLPRLIGKGRALEICLTGRRFNAEQALQWGFLTDAVVPDQLLERGIGFLKELTQLSATTMQSIISAIDQGFNLPLEEALAFEAAHFAICCASPDKTEGVDAFLNKRAPVFQ